MAQKSFKGGIHPGDFKDLTEKKPIVVVEAPEEVTIPLSQHIGAPARSLVKKGDSVLVGQKIGDSDARLTAPVHSSVSGTVKNIVSIELPGGRSSDAVVIANDGRYETEAAGDGDMLDPMAMDPSDIIERIKDAGIVGMGGATFPTYFKLNVPPGKQIDTLIINGVECEPYLTADHRMMLENPDVIIKGINILMRALKVEKSYIGIEENKPDAIKVMQDKLKNSSKVSVVPLHVKYPQGAEKQLIKAILDREVPSGGLPLDVGVVVSNIGTAAAVSDAFNKRQPLYQRVLTISGSIVKEPANILARIGTPVSYLIEKCGGLTEPLGKVIYGGPMMGIAHYTTDTPVTKGMSGVLLFSKSEAKVFEPSACIRCGKCINVCPMGLMPGTLAELIENEDYEGAEENHILDCIECGSCAYICPANRRIVQTIRQGKNHVMMLRRQRQAG